MAQSPQTAQRHGGSTRAMLVVICLALATVVSATASLNVAIPSIARQTHASQTELAWVIDAYALVFAALLLPGGTIGDRYGRRRALLAGLSIFGAASVAAMTVDSPRWLILIRGVLGIGAALVMPATLSTITSTFPAAERPRAVGAWAGVASASAVLGLLTSGALLEVWSWRAVFGLNVILAVAAIIGTRRFIPESADREATRLDPVGAVLAVAGLGALVYSIIEGPTSGWGSVRTLAGLGIGLLVIGGFVGWELIRRDPMLDPRLFARRGFAGGTLSITLQFFGFFGFIFLLLQYLQLIRGYRPIVAALALLPMAAAIMPAARVLAPRAVARIGTGRVVTAGFAVIAVGFGVLSRLGPHSSYWLLLAGLLPLGAGAGLAMTPATSAITDALPAAKQGVGSATNDLARELGGALGIAVLGSVMQSGYRSHIDVAGLPTPLAGHVRASVALAVRSGGPLADQARSAFADGMQTALIVAAVLTALAVPMLAFLLRGAPAARPREVAPQDGDRLVPGQIEDRSESRQFRSVHHRQPPSMERNARHAQPDHRHGRLPGPELRRQRASLVYGVRHRPDVLQ